MLLFFISFAAGVLTVLAPCILPLLPVIIGGSVAGRGKRNPYLIVCSLAGSIILFTILLKFSTALIDIPQQFWNSFSGIIIILFGLASLFPRGWEKISVKLNFSNRSGALLSQSATRTDRWGDILVGAALGPVFSSCSPTYFLILATVLPRSFSAGLIYLVAYAAGLSLVLLLVSVMGQRFIKGAKWAVDPNGWFKRGLGVLFILVGLFIITGADKRLQVYLIEKGFYPVGGFEQNILKKLETGKNMPPAPAPAKAVQSSYPFYKEIVNPSGFVNTDGITLGELIGKKVVMIDFMTYTCINCIRTFPYLNAWYDKYRDQGLEIVAIHTPEFAFEQKIENVRAALQNYGIKFPVVLDNDYSTWRAYGNNYWPHKYIIDLDGYIVYDHIGEGKYEETERKIQELLEEKMRRDKIAGVDLEGFVKPVQAGTVQTLSPETYFGSARNEYLSNGKKGARGVQSMFAPAEPEFNRLYLAGDWNFENEYAVNISSLAKIIYHYAAQDVFLVASADKDVKVKVLRDGKPLAPDVAGSDIQFSNGESYLIIHTDRLYNVIDDKSGLGEHVVEFIIESPGVRAYAFTFG